MRSFRSAVPIVFSCLVLSVAVAGNASAQDRVASIWQYVLSSVLRGDDGRTPTVILGDDARREPGRAGRTGDRDVRGRDGDVRERPRGRTNEGSVQSRRDREVEPRRGPTTRGDDDVGETRRNPYSDRDDRRGEGDGPWEGDDARGERGHGPAFCRSGAGHPVFGTSWCRDKGFGVGTNDRRDRRDEDRRRSVDDRSWPFGDPRDRW